ncbi:hypothetical protein [Coralloluteibacterium thermophilus]|uniref:Uncharacterized protein n=1 Tax=Coralloluteibacterium thermophilum TaxID=2707049 RepID=A0ABV9NG13_9GAMM
MTKIWSDEGLVELRILVTNEESSFSNTVYVGEAVLREMAGELLVFRNHVDGEIKDIRLGEFGPEYANGAFHARFHFRAPGKIFIATHQQSEFSAFSMGEVAGEAKMYLVSEPVLLDNFISALKRLASGADEQATLVCI